MSSVECPVVIPYFGGKYEMSRKMVHMIPEHERYIEVFFGGGSMFFRKPKAKFNVLNDIDSDLINLYLCVLDKFDELKKYIYWYPKSRSLHEMFREEIKEGEPLNELFEYIGEFKILSVKSVNEQGEKESTTIHRVMDYSELLNTNAEDLTTKSEDLKVTYMHDRKIRKTAILPKSLKGGKI